MDPVTRYLDFLHSQERHGTARTVAIVLRQYAAFLAARDRGPTTATTEDLGAYRVFLASPAASTTGQPLAMSTQAARLATVKGFHHFLRRRHLVVHDVTAKLTLPQVKRRVVRSDYLSLQEAQALLATAGEQVVVQTAGSKAWARAYRELALLALALATGRRRSGLMALDVDDLDAQEGELRVAWEKGRPGRVLPVAGWAVTLLVAYRDQARPILLRGRATDALFVGDRSPRYGLKTYAEMLERLHGLTCAAHPDLVDLPAKRLTSHSLRVTFARILFSGGCGIRSINELMLHRKLSTTAAYTPIPLEEMRRVFRSAHPRA